MGQMKGEGESEQRGVAWGRDGAKEGKGDGSEGEGGQCRAGRVQQARG